MPNFSGFVAGKVMGELPGVYPVTKDAELVVGPAQSPPIVSVTDEFAGSI